MGSSANSPHWPPLVVVGLTGGIASGKSTVARMFAELGATVLDADDEGRAAVEPGEPALAELIAAFGSEYLTPAGRLDRPALGRRVFSDGKALQILNRITHPRIAERLRTRLKGLADAARNGEAGPPNDARVVIVEAAVLIEAGWAILMDKIVVTQSQHSTQVSRLIARSGLTAAQAEARVRSQIPSSTRLRHADFVLDGELSLSETREQVRSLWTHLRRLAT
jgi:dephospho-CoA kinase